VSNVLGAIAKDGDASLAYLSNDGTLRTFLERWANDLDGDIGRNAAQVLEAAPVHPRAPTSTSKRSPSRRTSARSATGSTTRRSPTPLQRASTKSPASRRRASTTTTS